MVVAKGWRKGGKTSYCLMSPEFQFCKTERFCGWLVMVAQQNQFLHATEPHLKMVNTANLVTCSLTQFLKVAANILKVKHNYYTIQQMYSLASTWEK